jgi:hypothetical protein
MKPVDSIRNNLIDKILAIQNADFLKALDSLVSSTAQSDKVILSSEQKEILRMSQEDIKAGNVISHADLNKEVVEWLRER